MDRAPTPPPWHIARRRSPAIGRQLGWRLCRGNFLLVGNRPLLHCRGWPGSAASHRRHAAGAHDVERAEDVGVLHADAARAVAAHGVADQAAALAVGDGAVMRVDVGDEIVRDEILKVAGGHRTRIHGAVVDGLRVGQHDDHLFGALRECAFDGLRHVDLVRPLLGADGVAVQRVDDGIAAVSCPGVAGRQEDDDVAVDGVAFQIAFERRAVNLDVLHGDGLGAGNCCGNVRLHLGRKP